MRGDLSIPARCSPGLRPAVRQRRAAAIALGGLLFALALAAAPDPASASWAPGAFPASSAGDLLADDFSDTPVVSGDGRFVVFRTAASVLLGDPPDLTERYSLGAVRKDLLTGDVQVVAPPQRVLRSTGEPVRTGTLAAQAISRDGRYVLFGTSARLSDDDGAGTSPDVYVRDMDRPLSSPSAYELVSALDGTSAGAEYATATAGSVPGLTGYALSADGRKAVFVSAGRSNLPAADDITTPGQQVWVRDLDTRTTRLISRDKTDGSAAGTPAPQPAPGSSTTPPTAAISADGTTAVWTAGDAERQTPTAPREGPIGTQPALLWRDLRAITAPSRRVAGAVDLDDPACAPASYVPSNTATGPCYGPFVSSEGLDQTPAGGSSNSPSGLRLAGLSADGSRVLFSSNAFRRPLDQPSFRAGTFYLADMRPGVTRKSGVRVAFSNPTVSGRQPVENARLAADGRHAVFASGDNRFDGLQPIGTFPTGTVPISNIFSADLEARTVERVTTAPDGSDYATVPGTSTVPTPFPSADGTTAAFAAPDGNLFVGDANGVTDVLVARTAATLGGDRTARVLPTVAPVPASALDLVPPAPLPSRFFVTLGRVAVSTRTGTATLKVSVPTGGTLAATARGTVRRSVGRSTRRRTRTTKVTVGSARRTVKNATTVTLTVAVGSRARTALRRSPFRLTVQLGLTFRPRGAAATTAVRTYTLKRSYLRSR